MKNIEFKVGDKVVIREDLKVWCRYGNTTFVDAMSFSKGNVYYIKTILNDKEFMLSNCGSWVFTIEMFDIEQTLKLRKQLKIGDEVKIVKANKSGLDYDKYIGMVGRIDYVSDCKSTPYVIEFDKITYWGDEELELINKDKTFKVGDKVKRVWGEHCGMNIGDVGTIERVSKNGINIKEFGGLEWGHDKSNFIKIDNEEAVRTGRKFKIGDKVRVIKNLSDCNGGYLVGEVGVINDISNNTRYIYRINDIGVMGTSWCDEELELVEDADIKEIKTNRIKRVNDEGRGTQIEYDIIDNEIKFKISEEPIHITTVLKILLNASKLYNYEYERISPYKIGRRYINGVHEFAIDFIDVKNDFKHYHNVLLTTDKDMKMHGKYNFFIPDFLGLCVERNILDYDGKRFSVKRDIDSVMGNCKYIPCKPSIGALKNQGYIIPKYYKEL